MSAPAADDEAGLRKTLTEANAARHQASTMPPR